MTGRLRPNPYDGPDGRRPFLKALSAMAVPPRRPPVKAKRFAWLRMWWRKTA